MAKLFDYVPESTYDETQGEVTQESYMASSSRYSDLFNEKFTQFNPDAIVSGGNNVCRAASSIWRSRNLISHLATSSRSRQPLRSRVVSSTNAILMI